MSENALTTLDFGALKTRKTDVTKYASNAKFLRRIQLYGKGDLVERSIIKAGNYGTPTSKDEVTDLGNSIDILPLAVRDKVLDTNPEVPLAVYDPNHEEFQRIMADAVDEDGKVVKNSGIMFGPSFLVFERSTGEFYEIFFGNASGREEGKRMEPFLPIDGETAEENGCDPAPPIQCTLTSKYVERGKYKWWAPSVTKCSLQFDNLPPMETIAAKINEFVNAVIEGEEEEASEGERTR